MDSRVNDSLHAPWHTLSIEESTSILESDLAHGLSEALAETRSRAFGPNQLEVSSGRPAWRIFVDQFRSLVVLLLLAATGIALTLGEPLEAGAILFVVLANSLIGFFTEWRAQKTLASLRKQTVTLAQVVREGVERQIPASELVPGDLAILAAGARVPADGRIVEAVRLQIDEAALTGESQPVAKNTTTLIDPSTALGDRTCLAWMGTTVTEGRGRLLVTAIGRQTEVGRIGVLLEKAEQPRTPLEKKSSSSSGGR